MERIFFYLSFFLILSINCLIKLLKMKPVILLLLLVTIASCVDQSYDLEKDISLDMNVGGKLITIPVGYTDLIQLKDLIDETDVLITDENGNYSLTKSDAINPVNVAIDPVSIEVEEISIESAVLNFLPEGTASNFQESLTVPITGTFTADMERTSSFSINNEVPEELIAIRTVGVKESASRVIVSFTFEGIPSGIDKVLFDQFKITFPDFLVFSEEDHVVNGVLTLNGQDDAFNPHVGFRRVLTLESFDFSGMNNREGLTMTPENGKNMLIIDSRLSLKGTLKTTATIDPAELQEIHVSPSITVDRMQVETATGKVNPRIDPISESVALELTDDVDFLKEDALLDIHNPQILLTIRNTTGVPVNLAATMHAQDKQGNTIPGSEVSNTVLHINAAVVDGEPTETKFIISKQGTTKEGYETIRIDDLSNLTKVIPDKISINMIAQTDQNEVHHINLTKDMKINGDYQVLVPLNFDQIHVNYKDTIYDLNISDEINSGKIRLTGTAENSIPLGLELGVTPLDESGNEISDIVVEVQSNIAAGKGTGADAVLSPITVTLTAKDKSLSKLDALGLNIKADDSGQAEGGIPLNSNQYVRLSDIKLSIEGGLDIDLND